MKPVTSYKCYIIDDEPLAIKVIEQHLSHFHQFELCGSTTDPLKALGPLKSLKPDLLFLDIEMPEITGLELIGSLQTRPEIIITTAYREYAVEGFELNVLDYLVKPIPLKRFMQALDKFLEQKKSTVPQAQEVQKPYLLVRADRKTIRIKLDDILYVEGLKDYVKIVLENEKILSKISIGNFLKQLPTNQFLRIHKSFIVSKNKITAYTSQDVEIGKMEIPIGRVYKDSFLLMMKDKNH